MEVILEFKSENLETNSPLISSINDRLHVELTGTFGDAIRELNAVIFAGAKAGILPKSPGLGKFPRKTFRKAQDSLKVEYLAESLNEKEFLAKPTLRTLNLCLTEVLNAMLYVEQSIDAKQAYAALASL